MTVLDGHPARLATAVTDLSEAERAIATAVSDLQALKVGGTAQAVQAFRDRLSDSAGSLSQVHSRYASAVAALAVYQEVLAAQHRKADAADEERSAQDLVCVDARHDAGVLEWQALQLESDPTAPAWSVQSLWDRAASARSREGAAGAASAAAQAEIDTARSAVDSAAQVAIAAIDAGFEGTSDGFRDELAGFGEWLHDGWDATTTWMDDVIGPVVDEIREWMAEVAEWLGAVVLLVGAMVALADLVLVRPGLLAALVLDLADGGSNETAMAIVASLAQGPLRPGLWLLAKSETMRPDREVTVLGQGEQEPSASQWRYAAELRSNEPHSVADLVTGMGLVDMAGGNVEGHEDAIGVIDIRQIVEHDANGNVISRRWIVTLPSTQAEMSGVLPWADDAGATNDWTSNIALYYDAQIDEVGETQYERAVVDAMEEAGIGSDEPVLFAGFSQGGYIAHRMATDYADQYNIHGIVVAGSPVDNPPLPSDMTVIQFTNPDDDLVHQMDGVYDAPQTDTHRQYFGTSGHHEAEAYFSTAANLSDADKREANRLIDDFLIAPSDALTSSSSVQLEWHE